jgi:hypothetical protein
MRKVSDIGRLASAQNALCYTNEEGKRYNAKVWESSLVYEYDSELVHELRAASKASANEDVAWHARQG